MPYGFGKIDVKIPVISLNYMRVVEVWLDREHREYFYTREPSVRGYPVGDISKQIQFKEEHKCKDFKWFMENVAYEVYERFPKLPPNKAWGEVKLKFLSLSLFLFVVFFKGKQILHCVKSKFDGRVCD